MVKNVEMLSFKDNSGELGHLIPIEAKKDVPFEIKRIYYITGVPGHVTRGFHSHRKLEQVLLCVNGNVKIRLKTPTEDNIILLDNPSQGLYIGHMVWREMFDFSPGAVLLVLASDYYTEDDYIRDYTDYLIEAKNFFKE